MTMVCPRCTGAEIDDSGHCALCGFSPAASVLLQESAINEVQHVVQQVIADRFRIESLLGLGERSLVYLAHEVAHDRLVALKVIPFGEGVSQTLAHRFGRQATLCQTLRHVHVVTPHAFGTAATFLWYTMDHISGRSLGDVLRESGPLSLDRCLSIADQIASALDYAHRRGVPHGNLKPSNVFVDDHWVRVSDFAIRAAFGRHPESNAAGLSLGLPEYMAPEQFYVRSPMASADQYALAIVVYQCLTGTLPFTGDSFEEVARRQAQDAPPPLTEFRKDLPVRLSEAVNRALSKQPAGRYSSVLDFVSALGEPQAPPARRPTAIPRATRDLPVLVIDPKTRSRFRRWALALLASAAVGTGAVYLLRDPIVLVWHAYATWAGDAAAPASTVPAAAAGSSVARSPSAAPASAAGTAVEPTPPAETATLLVHATPWGQLFIDGVFIGDTPRANIALSPGRHLIRIVREGYEPFERELIAEPGQTIRLTGIVLRTLGS